MEASIDRSSLIGDAVLYTLNQEVYLRRYLEDGHLSIDNNSAERAIKNFAVGRRNWLFAKSIRGADASANENRKEDMNKKINSLHFFIIFFFIDYFRLFP